MSAGTVRAPGGRPCLARLHPPTPAAGLRRRTQSRSRPPPPPLASTSPVTRPTPCSSAPCDSTCRDFWRRPPPTASGRFHVSWSKHSATWLPAATSRGDSLTSSASGVTIRASCPSRAKGRAGPGSVVEREGGSGGGRRLDGSDGAALQLRFVRRAEDERVRRVRRRERLCIMQVSYRQRVTFARRAWAYQFGLVARVFGCTRPHGGPQGRFHRVIEFDPVHVSMGSAVGAV